MALTGHALGIDFGTSNSAAGYLKDGKPHLIAFDDGESTLPTTFFFDFDTRERLIGAPANQALLSGQEGRFMRALKRVLGTSLMHEKRQILNQRVTFVEIIAGFLNQIKTRAEAEAGQRFDHVLSGRPVVFHGDGDPREAQAEADLRTCYLAAGFSSVAFMAEPEAAAIANGVSNTNGDIGLVVDIGGGTSDFSLFRADGEGIEILANHGVRIGGTDFDRAVSIDKVMPDLGKGSAVRKTLGVGHVTTPNAIYMDLATWEKIPFVYTKRNRSMVADMVRLAEEPAKLKRLASVLENELGHDLAFAVEQGKIAANSDLADAVIDLDVLERGFSVPLPPSDLVDTLSSFEQALRIGAQDTLTRAGVDATRVDRVIYVGGSSLMSMVSRAMRSQFPGADHSFSDVFTAVADGLAIAAGRLQS